MASFERGKIRVQPDEHGVTVHDGSEGIWLDFEELRWLLLVAGPAALPRQPTPSESFAATHGPVPVRPPR